jgi:Ni/Co efflux regulator RcnB
VVRPAPAPQAYGRWQAAQRRYSAPRYVAPRGYQTRAWAYGQRLPAQYRTRSYVVTDYGRYGLRAPPRGYQYVRSGNDVVLTAVATGLITAVIAGLFN